MRVWLVWEDYMDDRILIGIASNREAVDKICEEHYKRYGTDTGNISWEEWEVDRYGGQIC